MTAEPALRSAPSDGSGPPPNAAILSGPDEPSFALTFDNEAVHLMELEAGEWSWRGAARLDSPDPAGRMAALRRLMPREAEDRVALIIPDDQILYTGVTIDPDLPRDEAVLHAVDGLTPYAVGDLALDWRDEAPNRVKVAAVWRQTLAEAQAFATRNGFVPAALLADTDGLELPGGARFRACYGPSAAPAANRDGTSKADPAERPAQRDTAAPSTPEKSHRAAEAELDAHSPTPLLTTEAEAMREKPPAGREDADRRAGPDTDDAGAGPGGRNVASEGLPSGDSDAQSSANDAGAVPTKAGQGSAVSGDNPGGATSSTADAVDPGDEDEPGKGTTRTSEELAASIARIRALSRRAAASGASAEAEGKAEARPSAQSKQIETLRSLAHGRAALVRRRSEAATEADAAEKKGPMLQVGVPAGGPVGDDGHASSAPASKVGKKKKPALVAAVGGAASVLASRATGLGSVERRDLRQQAAADSSTMSPTAPEMQGRLSSAAAGPAPLVAGKPVGAERWTTGPARGGLGVMLALLAAGLLVVFFFGGGETDLAEAEAVAPAQETPVAGVKAQRGASGQVDAVSARAQAPVAVEPPAQPVVAIAQATPTRPANDAPKTAAPTIRGEQIAAPAPSQATPPPATTATETLPPPAETGDAPQTVPPRAVISPSESEETAQSAVDIGPPVAAAAPQSAPAAEAFALPAPGASVAARSAIESALAEAVAEAPASARSGATAQNLRPLSATATPRSAPSLPNAPADVAPVLRPTTATPSPADAAITAQRPKARPRLVETDARQAVPAEPEVPLTAPASRPASIAGTQTAPAEQGAAPATAPLASSTPPVTSRAPDATAERSEQPAAPAANGPAAGQGAAAPLRSVRPLPKPESLTQRQGAMLHPDGAGAVASRSVPSGRLRLALAGGGRRFIDAEIRLLASMPIAVARGALKVHGPSEAALLDASASGLPVRFAQARPPRRGPAAAAPIRADAVEAAIGAAVSSAAPVAASLPQAGSRQSPRPEPRPDAKRVAAPAAGLLSADAVEGAIAAAISASPAPPGGIALSALRSSPLPPRAPPRDAAAEAAAAAVAAVSPVPATAPPPIVDDTLQQQAAAQAERRRLDDELQREVEARIRARASADAKIEAQQRAAAEARARAQAAAEERAAAARRQPVRAVEIDDEPDVVAAVSSGVTTASVAANATISRGMDLRRTTLIGVIGAGPASRGLIRLRNGRIVTVRLGDKIDGGTITSIGNSRVTYVKSGRPFELRMLDGR